ncbi:hypothetical protein FOCC_FOCC015198 [Frankliniella occidentalis]|nr:hypothetical protein FOCC_FOCC015198 [Frankliniella occidentalis]
MEVDSPDGENVSSPKTPSRSRAKNTTPKSKRKRRGELTPEEKEEGAQAKQKKFTTKWLNEDVFKGWIEPVKGDEKKMRCVPCGTVLAAGRTELLRHAETLTHGRNVKGIKDLDTL